ncbi:hypothetical protein DFH27DRAFT_548990, partial [Peziza echinospora]
MNFFFFISFSPVVCFQQLYVVLHMFSLKTLCINSTISSKLIQLFQLPSSISFMNLSLSLSLFFFFSFF